MARNDYFEKRFSFLLNEIRTRGNKLTLFREKEKVEMIYHFFLSFFHLFLTSFERLKNIRQRWSQNFVQFQEVINQ